MELDQKKNHIIRCVKLGMQFYESALVATCTDEEIEVLSEDAAFQQKVKITQAIQEEQLLLKHDVALEIAKQKGNSKPIEWRLSKLNKRYENSTKVSGDVSSPVNMTVSLKGEYPADTNKES
jgi:hypothetical protein